MMSGDDSELVRFLSVRFATEEVSLDRLDTDCVSHAYRGTIGGETYFVKWGENDSVRATAFLRVATTDLVVRPLDGFPARLGCGWVNVYPWRETVRVAPERMTETQFASFVAAADELFEALQVVPPEAVGPELDAPGLRSALRAYAERHPLAKLILRSLLSLQDHEILFPPEMPRAVIHGDFHCGNFGFSGEELTFFYDFDLLRTGSRVEDIVFLFADRVKRKAGGREGARILAKRLQMLKNRMGRPDGEWRIALNRLRLYAAMRLVERHPDRLRTAWTVLRRDRRLACLQEMM